jgi:hypothetical protein
MTVQLTGANGATIHLDDDLSSVGWHSRPASLWAIGRWFRVGITGPERWRA